MGRRRDPAALQEAKGAPRQKMTKARRRQVKAEEIAQLLVAGPGDRPGLFDEPIYAPAKSIWDELGPELRRTGRLQAAHVMSFAMFCGYAAEFWTYDREIREDGPTQRVKTVAGGYMERIRPVVRMREIALSNCLALGDRFGLTPTEEYKLFKDQQIVRRENPGLFGVPDSAGGASGMTGDQPAPPTSPDLLDDVGGMKGLRSEPPTLQ